MNRFRNLLRWIDLELKMRECLRVRRVFLPGRKKYRPVGRSTILIRRPSRRQPARVAPAAVAWCLPPSNSSPKVPCGTRSVSTVPNAIDLWTLCWPATDPTRKFTAELATASSLDPKDLVSVTRRLSSRPTEITLPRSKYRRFIIDTFERDRERSSLQSDSLQIEMNPSSRVDLNFWKDELWRLE